VILNKEADRTLSHSLVCLQHWLRPVQCS